jgi:hypothetical protein
MKNLTKLCYFAGYASIPISVLTYFNQAETAGIFIGLWVPTLLLSGMIVGSAEDEHEY